MYKTCIFICIKNEHDFLEYFVKYHFNLGIQHFYFLYDDDTINFSLPHSTFIKNQSNEIEIHALQKYIHLIDSEWIITLAPDMFLFFDNYNINNLIDNIDNDCHQIVIPWKYMIYNFNNDFYNNKIILNKNNLFIINTFYKNNFFTHTSNIFRKSNFIKYKIGGHLVETTNNKYFMIDKYYNYDFDDIKDFFLFVNKTLFNQKILFNTCIHIIIRSFDELFIKDMDRFSDYKLKKSIIKILKKIIYMNNKNNIIHFINNYKFKNIFNSRLKDNFKLINFINNYDNIDELTEYFDYINNKIKIENNFNFYNNRILKILQKINVSQQKYNEFKNICL